jgi:hypothetical protein
VVQFLIPVGEVNPLKRLKKIEKRIQNIKNSSIPLLVLIMAPLVASVPSLILSLIAKKILSRVSGSFLTSFPGPVDEMKFYGTCAGKEVRWGSTLLLGTRSNKFIICFNLVIYCLVISNACNVI